MGDFWSEYERPVRWSDYDRKGHATPVAKVHTNAAPLTAYNAIGLSIRERVAQRLGPMPNVKGDRPKEEE